MKEKSAVIITDSSCDLPEEIIENYPIKVMDMPVSIKEGPDIDISKLDIRQFYELMKKGELMPTTSQVPVANYINCFEECLKQGKVPIVLGLSSKLTGSYEAALLAKENLKADDVIIIDSKCASLGLGLVVLKAAKMAKDGKDPDEIAKEAQNHALHMQHIFTVDSLEHLKRGGRISAAQAFVGGLLNIKPLLHIVDGAILPFEKVRGRKNVIKRMLDIMAQRVKDPESQIVGISHGHNEEMAQELAENIRNRFGVKDIIISWIGPVVGSHSGPGTLALFFTN